MNTTDDSKLDHIYSMVEENNKILRSMRNAQRVQNVVHMLYWVVIIGFTVWSFQALGPLLEGLKLPNMSDLNLNNVLSGLNVSPDAAQNAINAAKQQLGQ